MMIASVTGAVADVHRGREDVPDLLPGAGGLLAGHGAHHLVRVHAASSRQAQTLSDSDVVISTSRYLDIHNSQLRMKV